MAEPLLAPPSLFTQGRAWSRLPVSSDLQTAIATSLKRASRSRSPTGSRPGTMLPPSITRIRSNAAIVERDGRRLSLFGRASAPQRRIATSDRLPGSPACLKWPHAQTAARAWHLGLVPTGEAASPPLCSDSQMRSGPQPRKTGRSARRMRTTRCLCRQASCSGKDRIPPGRPPGGRRRACRKLDKS
jgi:hypothetical protein